MVDRHLIPRVLIIDDTYFHRDRLRSFFLTYGMDVSGEAENGVKGVEMFERLHPDLVTMDVNMPFMNGIEAVREIKKIDMAARIIMVSAMSNPTTINEALLAGARDFIIKPFTNRDMAKKVKAMLSDLFPQFFIEKDNDLLD